MPLVTCFKPRSVLVRPASGVGTPSAVSVAATREADNVSSISRMRLMTANSCSGPSSQTTWCPAIWLLDGLAVDQLPNRRAVAPHQPAAEAVRRPTAGGEPGPGQGEL